MSSHDSPQTPTNFTKLPAELRNQIWDQVLSSSGSGIRFSVNCVPPSSLNRSATGWGTLTCLPRKAPALLSVNQESRSLALSHYAKGLRVDRYMKMVPVVPREQEARAQVVDDFGIARFLGRCKRVWTGKARKLEDSVICDHASKLAAAVKALYWDPQRDWLVIEQSREKECEVNANCRSVLLAHVTWFDRRVGKVVMSDCVRTDFEHQNMGAPLVTLGAFHPRRVRMIDRGADQPEWVIEIEGWGT